MTKEKPLSLKCPFPRCSFTFFDDENLVKELVFHFKARHTRRTYNMLAEKIAQDLQNDFIMSCRECKNKVMISDGYGQCDECETKYGFVTKKNEDKDKNLKEKILARIKELESLPKPNGVMMMDLHLEDKIGELKGLLPDG